MSFHVGQKVVCVKDDFGSSWACVQRKPRRGRIYTVRASLTFDYVVEGITPTILLKEIINPVEHWDDGLRAEISFWVGRFRPITERKTDISLFEKMLTDAPKEVEIVE